MLLTQLEISIPTTLAALSELVREDEKTVPSKKPGWGWLGEGFAMLRA